ncbi:UNVERIFIED_CONTAM: hypothetical protein K2H54_013967 [Gekko kuhli]
MDVTLSAPCGGRRWGSSPVVFNGLRNKFRDSPCAFGTRRRTSQWQVPRTHPRGPTNQGAHPKFPALAVCFMGGWGGGGKKEKSTKERREAHNGQVQALYGSTSLFKHPKMGKMRDVWG